MTTTIYVQFSDASDETIINAWSEPQDPTVWENQGTVQSDDARYATFYADLMPGFARFYVTPSE